ncbi:MAG TPA: FAD-dependent oxidoreductase, partial [Thermoanaerobaculia bacterium]|nr:FAD-dependent oxidoreductase [Thermoanaerobaculia bacterium]
MQGQSGHAVVLGSGVAGLLAAAALAARGRRVTVVERDPLPDPAAPRQG